VLLYSLQLQVQLQEFGFLERYEHFSYVSSFLIRCQECNLFSSMSNIII
jgi:hypothetical protein